MNNSIIAGSSEWWEARKKIMAGIAAQSRKRGVHWTPEQKRRSEAAMQCAFDDKDGQLAYERNGFTREQWFKSHFPQALEGIEISPADRMRLLRKAMAGVL